jgi:hypothetical protein
MEVAWQPERPQIFLGTPSILRAADGALLVTADRFGSGTDGQPANASVYRSLDNGTTWTFQSWALGQYWYGVCDGVCVSVCV